MAISDDIVNKLKALTDLQKKQFEEVKRNDNALLASIRQMQDPDEQKRFNDIRNRLMNTMQKGVSTKQAQSEVLNIIQELKTKR